MSDLQSPDLTGLPAECQNCGHIVPYTDSLELCPECGAGHWRNPPTHPLGVEMGKRLTEDGSCPVCGPDCVFDGAEAVLAFRNDHEDNPVHVDPPAKAKKRLIAQGHLTKDGKLPESHPFHPKNLAKKPQPDAPAAQPPDES